jgi:hypothetical protein
VRFEKRYVHDFSISFCHKCEFGALEEYQAGDPEVLGSSTVFVFFKHGDQRKITLVRFFREALRLICGRAEA